MYWLAKLDSNKIVYNKLHKKATFICDSILNSFNHFYILRRTEFTFYAFHIASPGFSKAQYLLSSLGFVFSGHEHTLAPSWPLHVILGLPVGASQSLSLVQASSVRRLTQQNRSFWSQCVPLAQAQKPFTASALGPKSWHCSEYLAFFPVMSRITGKVWKNTLCVW